MFNKNLFKKKMLFFRLIFFSFSEMYTARLYGYIRTYNPSEFSIVSIEDTTPFYLLHLNEQQASAFRDEGRSLVNVVNGIPTDIEYISLYNCTEADLSEKTAFPIDFKGRAYFVGVSYPFNRTLSDISVSVHESWGWLPLSQFPTMIVAFLETALYLILFTMTVVNRASHSNLSTKLNSAALLCVFIQFLFSFLFALILAILNESSYGAYTPIFTAFFGLRNIIVVSFALLLCYGLSLVTDNLTKCEYLLILFSSLLLTGSQCLLIQLSDVETAIYQDIIIVIFFIASITFYVIVFYKGIRSSLERLNGHLILCAEKGINPATVPTFKKIKFLTRFQILSYVLFLIMIISTTFFMVSAIPLCIPYLILSIATGIAFSFAIYYSWLRNSLSVEYADNDENMYIVDDEQELDPEIPKTEEDRLAVLRAWQIQMKLPPIPESFKNGIRVVDD